MKRELTGREREEARRVFGDSLDYGDIRISAALGLGGRPWARCGIGIYVIYVGIEGFRDAIAPAFAPTFIHELTHVWQGRNGRTAFDFMLKSAACQCRAFLTHPQQNAPAQQAAQRPFVLCRPSATSAGPSPSRRQSGRCREPTS
jgi:hypothetical protein